MHQTNAIPSRLKSRLKLLFLKVLYKLGFKTSFYFDNSSPSVQKMGYENARKLLQIEHYFNQLILREESPKERFRLYGEINRAIKEFKSQIMPDTLSYGFIPDYILEHQDLFKGKVVIDFGCGYGLSTELLSTFASHVHGIDCVDVCIASATERFHDISNINFHLVDDLALPFADASIDAAYSNDVIEHIHPEDALYHLQEIHRVLVDNGTYLIWTPGKTTGPHDITKAFWPQRCGFKALGSHIQEYTFQELEVLLSKAGFSSIKIPNPDKEVLVIAQK